MDSFPRDEGSPGHDKAEWSRFHQAKLDELGTLLSTLFDLIPHWDANHQTWKLNERELSFDEAELFGIDGTLRDR